MQSCQNYSITNNKEITQNIGKITILKEKIDSNKPLKNGLWNVIQHKLRINWIYHSNAIEGSTLTYGETIFFLQEGLTVEGKPFKDFLDARNHNEAIEFLMEVLKSDRGITESLIKEINALLLSGVNHTKAMDQFGHQVKKQATPGQYKTQPNHVLQPDGTIHHYVEPLHVPTEMAKLCRWINDNIDSLHPIIVAAIAHYNFVRIHPFDDGNGRGARILMNLVLLRKNYPVAIVKNESRRKYLEALKAADSGDLTLFVLFIIQSLKETMELIIEEFAKPK